MKFNHLNVPTHWRNYWTRYPEGHTILEALISWVSQVDSMVDNQNTLNANVEQFRNEIDDFVGRFDERLQDEVTQTLNDWQTSGFLDVVISSALQWELDDYKTTNEQNLLSIKQQLAQKGVDIKTYGAVGDGVTDDTEAIQTALNSSDPLFWSDGEYLFNKVTLTTDNKKIIFGENVLLKSYHTGDSLTEGAFTITGKSLSTVPIIENIQVGQSAIKLENTAHLNEGDFLHIFQDNPTGTTREEHRKKWIHSIVSVRGIDSVTNTVHLNEKIVHDFQTVNSVRATKIEPIKNVVIEGHATQYTKMGTTEYSSHFFVDMAYNLKIGGFETRNGGGKGITLYRTYQFNVYDWVHGSPTNVTSGHGYGTQSSTGSCYGVFDNITVYDSRHGVDLTTGTHDIEVRNSLMFRSNINGHGTNAKRIHIYKTKIISSNIGLGNNSFLSDEQWTIDQCIVDNTGENTTNCVFILSQSFDVTITNSQFLGGSQGVLIGVDSDNVRIENTFFDGQSLLAIGVRGKNVDVLNCQSVNTGGHIMYVYATASDVFVDGLIASSTSSTVIGFMIGGKNVVMANLSVKGAFLRVFRLVESATAIKLLNSHFAFTATRFLDELNHALEVIDLTIQNTSIKSNSTVNISTTKHGYKLMGCDITGSVMLDGTTGYIYNNNQLTGDTLRVAATSNAQMLNNYSTVSTYVTPEENATTVVANNIRFTN